MLDYRNSPHSTTGETPAKLLFNREMRTEIPQYKEKLQGRHHKEAKRKDEVAKEKTKVATTDIEVGDKVLLKLKKTNKVSTIYGKTKYTVKGTGLVIKGMNGAELLRNPHRPKS